MSSPKGTTNTTTKLGFPQVKFQHIYLLRDCNLNIFLDEQQEISLRDMLTFSCTELISSHLAIIMLSMVYQIAGQVIETKMFPLHFEN